MSWVFFSFVRRSAYFSPRRRLWGMVLVGRVVWFTELPFWPRAPVSYVVGVFRGFTFPARVLDAVDELRFFFQIPAISQCFLQRWFYQLWINPPYLVFASPFEHPSSAFSSEPLSTAKELFFPYVQDRANRSFGAGSTPSSAIIGRGGMGFLYIVPIFRENSFLSISLY